MVVPEETIERYSTVFSGFSDQDVSGKTFRNDTLLIRPAIEGSRSGRDEKSLRKSSLFLLKIWRPVAKSNWKNASLTEPFLLLKRGLSGGKNETGKGNEDHGDR